jgi:hypothetical protein
VAFALAEHFEDGEEGLAGLELALGGLGPAGLEALQGELAAVGLDAQKPALAEVFDAASLGFVLSLDVVCAGKFALGADMGEHVAEELALGFRKGHSGYASAEGVLPRYRIGVGEKKLNCGPIERGVLTVRERGSA